MVSLALGRRGSSGAGCLVSLLVTAAIAYYGIHIGAVYWKYYQLRDAMEVQARLAPSLTDDVIRRRVLESADEILAPDKALKVRIRRQARPARITIDTEYTDSVSLPLLKRKFHFRPHAEAQL